MVIGDRIREVRKAAGLTQEDVARRAGLTLKAVGELERSEVQDPHISSLAKIAVALGVEVADLLKAPVPLGEPPGQGQPEPGFIHRTVADGVGLSDDVRATIFGHLEALEKALNRYGVNGELVDMIAEMRKKVAA